MKITSMISKLELCAVRRFDLHQSMKPNRALPNGIDKRRLK